MVELPDFITIPKTLLQDRSLQMLDRYVYGVIYWFARLKNEKCTLSNQSIAEMTFSTPKTVSNSIARLNRKGYVRIMLDKWTNARLEIIPLVYYYRAPSTDGPPPSTDGAPPSTDGQNKRSINNKKRESTSDRGENPGVSDYRPKSLDTSHSKLSPLSPVRLWEIAMAKNVPLSAVEETHKQVLADISGENKYKVKDVNLTLHKWISLGISRGNIREMNEIERMDLETDHPDRIAKRQALMKKAVEEGLL